MFLENSHSHYFIVTRYNSVTNDVNQLLNSIIMVRPMQFGSCNSINIVNYRLKLRKMTFRLQLHQSPGRIVNDFQALFGLFLIINRINFVTLHQLKVYTK